MNNDSFDSELSPIAGSGEAQKQPHRFTLQRVYPALIFAPLFYLFVRFAPASAFFVLIFIVSSLAFWEFTKVTPSSSSTSLTIFGWMGLLVLLLGAMQWTEIPLPILFLTLLVVGILLTIMFLPHLLKRLLSWPMGLLFGTCYIGVCLGHLLLIRKFPSGDLLIFFVILVTWAADTGGYYIGASMGRRPIAPRLSPKKTIEGFVAGALFSVIMALICHVWFLPSLLIRDGIMIGILLACVGLLGDLAESAFKRNAGVKDSGALIPGHGGILDRIDSLLLTAPTFYYYVTFIKSTGQF